MRILHPIDIKTRYNLHPIHSNEKSTMDFKSVTRDCKLLDAESAQNLCRTVEARISPIRFIKSVDYAMDFPRRKIHRMNIPLEGR